MSIRVKFYDSTEHKETTFLECGKMTSCNYIDIRVNDSSSNVPICLDKKKAIRLVRELRKLISELD